MYEKWLKAFHMVASHGSFTHAARALNVGQPTISTHIKTLEDYFRVELFYRRGRSVDLTDVGKSLFTITQGLYGHEAEAVSYLRTIGRHEGGRLRLGAVGPHDVMTLTHAFRSRYPRVDLTVSVASRDEIMTGLAGFEIDVGVVADEVADSQFFCVHFDRHPVRVMVPRSHRLARRREIPLAALEGEPLILREPSSSTRRAFERALEAADVGIKPIMEINSREAVRAAVGRGMGLGVVSETEFAPHKSIRLLRLTDADIGVDAYVLCLSMRRNRPLVEAFIQLAIDTAKGSRASPAAKGRS
jgi:aminoethylphosphonate catabolism LysR family transcriptional regulator